MVQEVKFLGVGPIGPFSYERRFPGSSAKPLKIPSQAQSTSKEVRAWRPAAGFRAGALGRSSSWPTEGLCCGAVGPARSKHSLSRGSEESFPRRARAAVPPAVVWPS